MPNPSVSRTATADFSKAQNEQAPPKRGLERDRRSAQFSARFSLTQRKRPGSLTRVVAGL